MFWGSCLRGPENAFHAFLDQFWTFVAVLILVPRRQGHNPKLSTPEFLVQSLVLVDYLERL